MRLKDKVVFITGAGSGVGRAASKIFAREGAKIVVVDIDPNAGRETVDRVKQQGGVALFVLCDVAVEADVKKAIETGVSAFGKLNILYTNAGVLWRDKDLEVTRTDETTWPLSMPKTIFGPILSIRDRSTRPCKKNGMKKSKKKSAPGFLWAVWLPLKISSIADCSWLRKNPLTSRVQRLS